MTDEDIARRRAAKRFNERIKLLATFGSNSGVATFVAGYVLPNFTTTKGAPWSVAAYAIALHFVAQMTLTLYKSED